MGDEKKLDSSVDDSAGRQRIYDIGGGELGRSLKRRELFKIAGGVGAALALPSFWVESFAQTKPAPKARKIKLAQPRVVLLSGSAAFYFMPKEKGFWMEKGLDVDIIGLPSGTDVVRALVSGEVHLANAGTSPIMPAIEKGAKMKIVGSMVPKSTFMLYAKKEISSLKELYGKNVGTGAPGAILHTLVVALMERQNLDPSKVNFFNIGSTPEIYRALLAGKIDAGVSLVDFITDVEKNQNLHAITDFGKELPEYLFQALFAMDETIEKEPQFVTDMLLGIARGLRYTFQKPSEGVELSEKITKISKDKLQDTINLYIKRGLFDLNLEFTPEAIEFTQKLSIKLGAQKEVLPFDKVATLKFQKEVLKQLGRA